MQVYCQYCERYLDSKRDPEHWDDKGNCVAELESKSRRKLWWTHATRNDNGSWEKQTMWGDAVNKKNKENREDASDRINPPEHK